MILKSGSTDVSCVIRIIDSTDGTPETGVEHNSTGIDLWYRRDVDPGSTPLAKVPITEAALASLTTAHADGGIEHIGDGYYRLDLEDAAVAAGAVGVMIGGTVTGMIVIGTYIGLVDYDPQDSVRLGITALPNAAADAAGGLPISDAGGLDLDSRLDADISSRLAPTVASRTLDVTATGAAGIDWGNIENKATANDLSATDIQLCDLVTANTDMRGTDSAALASNWTATRAGYVDNLNRHTAQTGDSFTRIGAAGAGLTDMGGMSSAMKAEVNSEVLDVINADTFAEPGQGAPGATVSLAAKIGYLYKAWRNKSTMTSTTYSLFADDASTVDQKATVSDDGTTATINEKASGP